MAAAKPPGSDPLGDEIPDLSLPPASPVRAQSKPGLSEDDFDWMEDEPGIARERISSAAATAARPLTIGGLSEDDFDWMEDGADDGSGALSGAADFSGFEEAASPGRKTIPLAAAVREEPPKRPLPTGTTPTGDQLRVTEAEVEAVAGYGPIPPGWYLAPPYSLRVFQQRRGIRARLRELRAEFEVAEVARDRALADVAADWRPRLTQDDRFADLFARVDEAESRRRAQERGIAEANDQHRELASRIDTQRTELENQRTALLEAERQKEVALEATEEQAHRAAAQVRRLEIVLRHAADSSNPQATRSSPERIAEAEAELPSAKHVLASRQGSVKEAMSALRAARADTNALNRELRQLDLQRRQLDNQFTKESTARSAMVAEVERASRAAGAEVARALLRLELASELSDEEVNALHGHDVQVARLAADIERHVRALDSYSREAYSTGILVAGGAAVGFVVLLLVLLFAMRGCGGAADPPLDSGSAAEPQGNEFEATDEEWEESK